MKRPWLQTGMALTDRRASSRPHTDSSGRGAAEQPLRTRAVLIVIYLWLVIDADHTGATQSVEAMPLVGIEDDAVFAADDHRRVRNVHPGRGRRVDVIGDLQLESGGGGGPAHCDPASRQAVDGERRRLHGTDAHQEAALTAVAAIVGRRAGHGGD